MFLVWSVTVFVPLLASAAWYLLLHRPPASSLNQTWSTVTLPEQALWTNIPHYYRHPSLPILTFVTPDGTGLGDPTTLATIHRRFVPRPTDVHIVTYPKAGTSWIQEVVWLINHDGDIPASNALPSSQRTIYIELNITHNAGGVDRLTQLAEIQDSPRHIKWHHSPALLPRQVVDEGTIIYLLRNPKDTVVSWYHFQKSHRLYGFVGTFDQFFDLFLQGHVAYGCYWYNVLSWWKLRHRPNVLFLTYEEMQADLSSVVARVAHFLQKPLTPPQVAAIVAHCQFRQMQTNPSTNAKNANNADPQLRGEDGGTTAHLRQGKVGDWRHYLSPEQERRMDAWMDEHVGDEQLPLVFG